MAEIIPFLVYPVVMIFAWFIPTRDTSPITMVVDAVVETVRRRWAGMQSRESADLDRGEQIALRSALTYLARRKAGEKEAERRREAARYYDLFTRSPQNVEKKQRASLITLLSQIAGAVIVAIAFAVVVGLAVVIISIPTALAQLTLEDLGQLMNAVAAILTLLLIRWILPRLMKNRYEFAFALGSGASWWLFRSQTVAEIQAQQDVIARMIPSGNLVGGISEPEADPDLAEAVSTVVPVPPGITEYVLQANETAVADIRSTLKMARSLHLRMSTVSFVVFILAVLGSVYLTLSGDDAAWKTLFGGLGLGAMLGTFSYLSQQQVRTAQIALGLFESYVAELRVSLWEAEQISDSEKRAEKRNIAWQKFRRGLNDLWLKEDKRSRALQEENRVSPALESN